MSKQLGRKPVYYERRLVELPFCTMLHVYQAGDAIMLMADIAQRDVTHDWPQFFVTADLEAAVEVYLDGLKQMMDDYGEDY